MATKNPTNKDLSRDLGEVKEMIAPIAKKVTTLWNERERRIGVDEYLATHPKARTINQDLVKAILLALGVISTLVYAYVNIRPH